VNGRYAPPENLGAVVNSAHAESNVFVAPDESYVVFSGGGRPDSKGATERLRSAGNGNADVYVIPFALAVGKGGL
jgi:hypothetical protein